MRYEQPVKDSAKQEKQGNNSSVLDSAIKMMEYETKTKMPEDREELFNNFDKYVPKDLKEIFIATQPTPTMFDRNGIRERLEKVLYGSSMKEIDKYFDMEMGKFGEFSNEREIAEYSKLQEATNDLTAGNFTIPLAHIEEKIAGSAGEERENLRNFAQRLTREMYKDMPKMNVSSSDIQDYLNKEKVFLSRHSSEEQRGNAVDYENAISEAGKGNFRDALGCIENDIHFIQTNLINFGKRGSKEEAGKTLQERYGDNFNIAASQELEKLRNYREFLREKIEGKIPTKEEKPQAKNEQKKEKLEGEELFKYQIENNSHSKTKNLKDNLPLFMKHIDDSKGDLQFLKEELSEILYRNDLEYTDSKDVKVGEMDKQIFEPLLSIRKEMDSWDAFTGAKKDNLQKRMIEYLKDTFGIETQKPEEGEKFDKKNMHAVKVEKTKNEFLDKKIKKVNSPGFEINDKFFDYYKKWYSGKDQEIRKKWNDIKGTISSEEFSRVMQEDRTWLDKYLFKKSIKPAYVEIYKFE